MRTIFAQPDAESVRAQHARAVEPLRGRFTKAADMLADAAEELLAFTAFPKGHWRQIWSNNPQERLNRETRRRTDVVGVFPNREAITRLVGAVLCEIHDDWAVVRRYRSPQHGRTAFGLSTGWHEAPIGALIALCVRVIAATMAAVPGAWKRGIGFGLGGAGAWH